MSTSPEYDTVDVSVPLRPRHASVLRTIAATLGADAGFSIDEIDDLRLGISEVFTILVDGAGADARVTVRFHVDTDAVTVTAAPAGGDSRPGDVNGDSTGEWRGQRNGLRGIWLRDDFLRRTL